MKKTRSYFILVACLSLGCACSQKSLQLSRIQSANLSVQASDSSLAHISALIKPYKDSLDQSMHEVLCYNLYLLEKQQPEGSLGNLVANAVYEVADGDSSHFPLIALVNYGGIRLPSIGEGPITTEKVFELQPFENELVILQLSGVQLAEVLDAIAEKGGWPIAGARFTIRENKAINIQIADKPFDLLKTYFLITSDYIANGGDNMNQLRPIPQQKTGIKVREAVIRYLMDVGARGDSLDIGTEERIVRWEE